MENIIEDLYQRGLLDNFSDKDKIAEMLKTPQTIYCGFDPSAPSLQLGNFVMITILHRLQMAGHRIVALIGGGTGMIGDPSGKKAERVFQDAEKIKHNVECIKAQLSLYLDFSTPEKGVLVDNGDWWSKVSIIEFLRDYGKLFSVNYMLAKDVVASRLEVGISYAEFSYMILQSGDFYRLHEIYGCSLQIGGGDQWGNLTSSLDFVRKKDPEAQVEVFSAKLITDSEGKKFGKSEKGALYLDSKMCSPYFIYQYFINVSDSDVGRYMKIFDDRPLAEIQKDIEEHFAHPELRLGQKKLADLIVSKVHSPSVAEDCKRMSEALFNDDFSSISLSEAEDIGAGLPSFEAEGTEIGLLDALVGAHLASSKREAREFVSAGSVKVNGQKITDLAYILKASEGLGGQVYFLKRGKRNYGFLNFLAK
ncbi:MAG: tyrosine--tRNA ligase [Bacilli bacterium]|jgi:tyrosyl-tRNA synthetase|nr:tyrosine--tRNA ligase [Bacilli bacterium]